MTAPDGFSGDAASAFELTALALNVPRSVLFDFPGSLTIAVTGGFEASSATTPPTAPMTAPPTATAEMPGVHLSEANLPEEVAAELRALAEERNCAVESLLNAAALLIGAGDTPEGRLKAARAALTLTGRGDHTIVPKDDVQRLESRVELLEYRGKALTNALERVSFQPLDGGIRDVRDAAQLFGFANEWCFDEDRVRRRFRELAPVYHPDTGVVADRERMTQLIEARALLVQHVRTAYTSGRWADTRRGR